MSDDVKISGGYSPLRISGKEYNARTFSEKDHTELNEFVQLGLINLARKVLTPDMPQRERDEILQAAIKTSAGVKWGSEEGWRIMTTLEGFLRMGWQMIRHGHPDISFEQFKAIALYEGNGVADKNPLIQANIDEIDRIYVRLNTAAKKVGSTEADQGDASSKSKSNEERNTPTSNV